MSKLWVFGDSYGVHIAQDKDNTVPWFWAYSLAKKLNCDSYKNYSQMGVSNEYTHHLINENKKDIKEDDYVIVITTSIFRKWFFKDRPFISNFYVNNFNNFTSRNEFDAVKNYILHLKNDELDVIYFEDFLGWLHFNSIKHKWNMIIIPGFEGDGYDIGYRYNVKGSLLDVCNSEFKSKQDEEWFYSDICGNSGLDARAGHLIKDNHHILTEKMFNTFQYNHDLDLTVGFKEKIIYKENEDFLSTQLSKLKNDNDIIKGFVPEL